MSTIIPPNPLPHHIPKPHLPRHPPPLQILQPIPILHGRRKSPLKRTAHHDFLAKQASGRGRAVHSGVRRDIAEHAAVRGSVDGVWRRGERAGRESVFFVGAAEVGRVHGCGWVQQSCCCWVGVERLRIGWFWSGLAKRGERERGIGDAVGQGRHNNGQYVQVNPAFVLASVCECRVQVLLLK